MLSAHDYRHLVGRWRRLAESTGVKLSPLCRAGKFRLFYLRTPALKKDGGIYVSAGIHGDEPAATEALITWAERNSRRLSKIPLLLFPCLNPWGLSNNSRFSEEGLDLNRSFHRDELPLIAAVKLAAASHNFDCALMMHEDYDGQGLYIYEVERRTPFWAEDLLNSARPVIPIEGRTEVDGFRANAGIIRRKINLRRFDRIGYPEAIWLHREHSQRTFTVETPSEFDIGRRVEAHAAVLDEVIRKALRG